MTMFRDQDVPAVDSNPEVVPSVANQPKERGEGQEIKTIGVCPSCGEPILGASGHNCGELSDLISSLPGDDPARKYLQRLLDVTKEKFPTPIVTEPVQPGVPENLNPDDVL